MTTGSTVKRKTATTYPDWRSVTLRTWQQCAVTQWHERNGLLVVAGVGSGKSLVGARVAATGSRPVVVVPAAVRQQTEAMYRAYGTTGAVFISYTQLTLAKNAELLEALRPDVLVLDEAHRIKRVMTNSAAKRIQRYLVANPAVRVCVLSASLITDRVTDFCHLAHWALRGAVRGLVPQTRSGAEQLQERLDADPAVRAEFMRRLLSTPGVMDQTTDAEYQGRVEVRVIRREPALTLPATWELPDGYLLTSPAQAAEVSRLMAWGAWLRVTPRPSERYLAARRAWSHTVRGVIGTGAADTELQVRALRPAAFAAYVEAENAEPRGAEEVVWEDHEATWGLHSLVCQYYVRTIVWADRRALQDQAAYQLDCPLHRERGLDADGVRLDETRAPLVVASIEACSAGLNCQTFSHNLVLEPPSDPETWRQLIGRTARQNQTAPIVTVDIVVNCAAAENALRTAIARARVSGKPNPILQLDGQDW